MIMPTPRVAEALARERRAQHASSQLVARRGGDAIRVRVGRVLISAGRAIGGDRADAPLRGRPTAAAPTA